MSNVNDTGILWRVSNNNTRFATSNGDNAISKFIRNKINFENRSKYYCIIEKIFNTSHNNNKNLYLIFLNNKIAENYDDDDLDDIIHHLFSVIYKYVKNRCGRTNEYQYENYTDLRVSYDLWCCKNNLFNA